MSTPPAQTPPGAAGVSRAPEPARIEPIAAEHVQGELAAILAPLGPAAGLRLFRTVAHHPELLRHWIGFGNQLLLRSSLPARERELAILRVAHLSRAQYVLAAHAPLARAVGLSAAELARLAPTPPAPSAADEPPGAWSDAEAALLRAADELCSACELEAETWRELAARYDVRQLLELIFTVGQYRLVAMLTNALRILPESGSERLPAPPRGS